MMIGHHFDHNYDDFDDNDDDFYGNDDDYDHNDDDDYCSPQCHLHRTVFASFYQGGGSISPFLKQKHERKNGLIFLKQKKTSSMKVLNDMTLIFSSLVLLAPNLDP